MAHVRLTRVLVSCAVWAVNVSACAWEASARKDGRVRHCRAVGMHDRIVERIVWECFANDDPAGNRVAEVLVGLPRDVGAGSGVAVAQKLDVGVG